MSATANAASPKRLWSSAIPVDGEGLGRNSVPGVKPYHPGSGSWVKNCQIPVIVNPITMMIDNQTSNVTPRRWPRVRVDHITPRTC